MERFGTEYGGFYYPKNLDGLDSNSIIYCVGAGEDISHDIVLAKKLDSKVYIIDPTPRAIKHCNYIKVHFPLPCQASFLSQQSARRRASPTRRASAAS